MVNLGDYLGQLLAELTIARTQADLEAVRIAELYANHELLKHFPIPRLRVHDIELDIPVVINKTEDPPTQGSPRGGLPPEELRDRFLNVLERELERYSLQIDEKEREELLESIQKTTDRLVRPEYVQVDTNLAADRFTSVFRKSFEHKRHELGPKNVDRFVESIRRAARADFINARIDIPRVVIGATSGEIREQPAEAIVRISLRISEESLEWTYISSDEEDGGDGNFRLVPE
jgi:hypothetical protein